MSDVERQVAIFDNDGKLLFISRRARVTLNDDDSYSITDLDSDEMFTWDGPDE